MLTAFQKQAISAILEDYSTLQKTEIDIQKRTAVIRLLISKDEETNRCSEPNDWTWLEARDDRYTFTLSGLSRIAISAHTEVLPKELANLSNPSPEFALFVAALFDGQPIYEWDCFASPETRLVRDWTPTWSCELDKKVENDCLMLFKERNGAVWVMGLWFSKLRITKNFGPLTVGHFIAQYPKRLTNRNVIISQ